jgi:monooxygenase
MLRCGRLLEVWNTVDHFDVLIIGAGLSGIGAAHHIKKSCPDKTFAILERREQLGGTWDLFRYPGVRSDSDMHTLGYAFRPWTDRKAIADGDAILRYINQTATETDIHGAIRYRHHLRSAEWSSATGKWTVRIAAGSSDTPVLMTCDFLYMCTGYYNYDRGHDPVFQGCEDFSGRIVHPQFWPQDMEYDNRNVAVIGSGATAITLVPALAEKARLVTMIQRSPTYVATVPSEDTMAIRLHRWLPHRIAHQIIRTKNLLFGVAIFLYTRWKPDRVRKLLIDGVASQLPYGYDVGSHFTPRYNPWDQRLCVAPDGDLFKVIRERRAAIETGDIKGFTATGIEMASGHVVPADIIVTATGLDMALMSGIEVKVDGQTVDWGKTTTYKGFMYSGVPNLASSFGYTMASWTLKSDLIGTYLGRLFAYMDRHGVAIVMPDPEAVKPGDRSLNHLTSGYVMRARDRMPRQGDKAPWKSTENYFIDLIAMRFSRIDDGALLFSNPQTSHHEHLAGGAKAALLPAN